MLGAALLLEDLPSLLVVWTPPGNAGEPGSYVRRFLLNLPGLLTARQPGH
jgi:hypothetical protein